MCVPKIFVVTLSSYFVLLLHFLFVHMFALVLNNASLNELYIVQVILITPFFGRILLQFV